MINSPAAATLSNSLSVCRLSFINITLGGMDEIDCLCSRGHAVQCIDYLEAGNVELD
jgi:hypothetical protein